MDVGLQKGQSLGDASEQQLQLLGRMGQGMNMGKDPTQALQALSRLEQVSKGKMTGEDFQAEMEKMSKSPEYKKLDDINKSNAGQLDELKAMNRTILDKMGAGLNPIATKMQGALNSIDGGIWRLVEHFNPTEKTRDEQNASKYMKVNEQIDAIKKRTGGKATGKDGIELSMLEYERTKLEKSGGIDMRPHLNKDAAKIFNENTKSWPKQDIMTTPMQTNMDNPVLKDINATLKTIAGNTGRRQKIEVKGAQNYVSNKVND